MWKEEAEDEAEAEDGVGGGKSLIGYFAVAPEFR